MLRWLCGALALLAAPLCMADEPVSYEEPANQAVTWRAGTLITKDQAFLLLGVGIQLRKTEFWTIEAAADVAVSEGIALPSDDNGLFGAVPLSLSGLYHPLPDLKISPFLEMGAGIDLITQADPDPFLHGGGGASYQSGDWSVSTDVRFLFLPGSTTEDPIDEHGVQMTFALQRGF